MIYHIIPVNDLREHEDSSTCRCHPSVEKDEESGDLFIVHNSYDGREIKEEFIENIKDRLELELKN
jgi:hypothetical protein